jgi:CRP-like cAMP-binding protein
MSVPHHGISFHDAHSEEDMMVMCSSTLFTGLSPAECREILRCAKKRSFGRDELLFSQGQPATKLALIQNGRVKLTQVSPEGNEVILWINCPGDAVGVHAQTLDCNHSCSARAMERCQVLVWEFDLLQAFIVRYPRIRVNLGTILADRLRELEQRFHEIASERVPKRLAMVLLRLVNTLGKESRAGVDLEFTRKELAQMTGTTLFTISRILSRWGNSGFIVPRREGILILDQDRLRRLQG